MYELTLKFHFFKLDSYIYCTFRFSITKTQRILKIQKTYVYNKLRNDVASMLIFSIDVGILEAVLNGLSMVRLEVNRVYRIGVQNYIYANQNSFG